MTFERLESETVWEGRIAVVRRERWREEDGEEVEREVVGHPGRGGRRGLGRRAGVAGAPAARGGR